MLHGKASMNKISLKFSFHRQRLIRFFLLNKSAYTSQGYFNNYDFNPAEFSAIFRFGFQEILFALIYLFEK